MSNRAALAWLAGLSIAAALIAGFVPVHANGVGCGSALTGSSDDARFAQYGADIDDAMDGIASGLDFEADCASRRNTQRAFVIPLLIAGLLAGGFLALTVSRAKTEPGTKASP